MRDTQRSQIISPESQRIAEQSVLNFGKMLIDSMDEGPPMLVGQSSMEGIKRKALNEPDLIFTSLVHRIDFHLLKQSFRKVRGSKSCGVDKMTAKEYAEHLDTNLYKLLQRLRRGRANA